MRGQSVIKRNYRGKTFVIGHEVAVQHYFADGKTVFGPAAVAVGRLGSAAAIVSDHGLSVVYPVPAHHMRTGFVHGMASQHAMRKLRILLAHEGRIGVRVMRMADGGLADRRGETKSRRHQYNFEP